MHWLPMFLAQLQSGLERSQWLQQLRQDEIKAAREICQELWPFIQQLPDNIASVSAKLPPEHQAARQFLRQLADDELHYQNLFLNQCQLAGLDASAVRQSLEIPHSAERLIASMRHYCSHGSVQEGVQAIVVAELAATQFARVVLNQLEIYFAANLILYGKENIENGLSWLRLHAKTNTRHALWMRRMLEALENDQTFKAEAKKLPPAVEEIMGSVFELWHTAEVQKDNLFELDHIR